jgi:hypothetical protein
MTDWTAADLAAINADDELDVAVHRTDGTLRTPRIVWHVVVDNVLYIRSVRGQDGAWYRAVEQTRTGAIDAGGVRAEVVLIRDDTRDDAVDAAYHAKYGNGLAVDRITAPAARATTLRVEPR